MDGSIIDIPYTETRSRSMENVAVTKLSTFFSEGRSLSADVCQWSPLQGISIIPQLRFLLSLCNLWIQLINIKKSLKLLHLGTQIA